MGCGAGGGHKRQKVAEKGMKRMESLSLKEQGRKERKHKHPGMSSRRHGNSETLAFCAEPEFDQQADDDQSFGNITVKCP